MARRKTKSILFVWRTAVLHSQMPPTRRLVLLGFAEHMNAARGDSCWPADGTVGEEIGYSRQTVNKHKTKAIRDGWLLQRPREKRAESRRSTYKYHAHFPDEHPAWHHLSESDAAYLERTATEWRSAMEQVESEDSERGRETDETSQTEQAPRSTDALECGNGDGQAARPSLSATTDRQPVNGQEPTCQRPDSLPVNGQERQPIKSARQAESRKTMQDNALRSPLTKSHEKLGSQGGSHSLGGRNRGRAQAGARERGREGNPTPPDDGSPGPHHVPRMPGPDADGHFRCTEGCGSIVGGPQVICASCRVAAAEEAS